MLELLEQLFRKVRAYLQSERFDRYLVYSRSTEHTTMQFDREAEDIIISGLIESGQSFEIMTEERPTFSTSNEPAYRIIIDPVDGTTNVSRSIPTAGISLAVLLIDKPISPENVQWALVGELYSGTVYEAQHALGAFCNGHRCQVSKTSQLEHCLSGMNFDGRDDESKQEGRPSEITCAASFPLCHPERSGDSRLCEKSAVPWRQPWAESIPHAGPTSAAS